MDRLRVSAPPHIGTPNDTKNVMLDVLIALFPAMIASVYFFGYRSALIIISAVGSAIAFEHIWSLIFKKPTTVWDLSCVVSGVLLAFNMPVTVPLWLPIVGSFFMIVIVKMCFGGIGQNFLNPALAARAFLMASWPSFMTNFCNAGIKLSLAGDYLASNDIDALTYSTPLAMLKSGTDLSTVVRRYDMFIGNIGGCLGETSAIALLIGGAYLVLKRVINWEIPLTYIAVVTVLSYLLGYNPTYYVLAGGLLLGAIFMATDYTTTPMTVPGRIVFGAGCGIITCVIRKWGGYPEGVSYAILIMNVVTPLIDKFIKPQKYGKQVKGNA